MFGAVLQPGDVMHHRMAGGGGHGNPLARDPRAVAQDVLDDKVSVAAARDAVRRRRRPRRRARPRGDRGAAAERGSMRAVDELLQVCVPAPDCLTDTWPIETDMVQTVLRPLGLPTSRPYAIEPNRRNRHVSVTELRQLRPRFVHSAQRGRMHGRHGAWHRAGARRVTVGSALLASAGGDRVSVLLGLEPAWPAAHALGPALTVAGRGGRQPRAAPRRRGGRAGRRDRARGRRRDRDRALRRHRRARRTRAGRRRDRGRRRDPRPRAARVGRRARLPPRHLAARARQGGPGSAARAGHARAASPSTRATSSAPTRTASRSSRPPTPTRCSPPRARSRSASARSSRRSSAARRRSRSSG